MSATNDVSQSEDSANSLIDRSSAAASTKKRDAPSDSPEDDGARASDAAPDAPSASSNAKRRSVEDPAPTSDSRAVVGVSRGRLVLLDPAWRAPRLECVSAGDLASRANQFEILVVRPGVRDANTLPTGFSEQA